MGVKCYLIIILICISLMNPDAEHFFHVPVGHFDIFFGEMSLQDLCPFFSLSCFGSIFNNSIYIQL